MFMRSFVRVKQGNYTMITSFTCFCILRSPLESMQTMTRTRISLFFFLINCSCVLAQKTFSIFHTTVTQFTWTKESSPNFIKFFSELINLFTLQKKTENGFKHFKWMANLWKFVFPHGDRTEKVNGKLFFFPLFIVSRIVIQFFYLTELKSGQINNWVYVHHLVIVICLFRRFLPRTEYHRQYGKWHDYFNSVWRCIFMIPWS